MSQDFSNFPDWRPAQFSDDSPLELQEDEENEDYNAVCNT